VTADLRAYRAVAGGALALRLRGGAVQSDAAFYDRYHLGGLYTVRGFPSQSLSPPEGDTRFWTAALEFRAPLAGRSDRPRVLGFVFADAGDGDGKPAAASAGFGFRIRVPWFDSLGIDFGMPITESPVDEAFHANAALGWNF
jgi:outer membrane protein assembly factor BamA